MFDKAIIDTDRFMDLPMSAKAIYFLMGIEADDEGFVSPKKVLRVHGGNEDDVRVLITKGFLIPFDSGVVVITDWNKNNWLDSRRIRSTEYKREKSMLALTEDKTYVLSDGLALVKPEERSIEEKRVEQKPDSRSAFGEMKNVRLTAEEYEKLSARYGRSATNHLIEELSTYMAAQNKRYASHYATLLNWAKRKGTLEVKAVEVPKSVQEAAKPMTQDELEANKQRMAKVREGVFGRKSD